MTHSPSRDTSGRGASSSWQLQDAKARFSEVIRRAAECGPQHVTVNGQERAVVISSEEYLRLRGQRTGRELIELLAASPLAEVVIEHPKARGPTRDVDL